MKRIGRITGGGGKQAVIQPPGHERRGIYGQLIYNLLYNVPGCLSLLVEKKRRGCDAYRGQNKSAIGQENDDILYITRGR
jgi:hypothetical protein